MTTELSVNTPALLFPALSLLLLAYTNRFLALASVARSLHATYRSSNDEAYLAQIRNLRKRIRLIRNMQFFGVLSILLCTICMGLIYLDWSPSAKIAFAASLLSMILSLLLALQEIALSGGALDLQLSDIETSTKA
jgi:hypothetical protein